MTPEVLGGTASDPEPSPSSETSPYDEDTLIGGLLPDLFAFAAAISGDRTIAEDLVIEAAARALPRLRRGGVDDLAAYLRRSIVNQMTSWGRRRQLERRQRAHERSVSARDALPAPTSVLDRLLLDGALGQLPVRQRAVLVLRFLEDRSVEDVAALMGTSTGTVKTQTWRGLSRLRQTMEDDHG